MAFIRPYRPSDEEAVIHVFYETAAPDLRAHPDPLVLHYGCFLWCRNYLDLSPSHCFVLDDGNGTTVGYIVATDSTKTFAADYRSKYISVVESRFGFTADSPATQIKGTPVGEESDLAKGFRERIFKPEWMLNENFASLIVEYPANLHIDILSSHTGQGWGKKLINTLLEKLRAEDVKGIHLGMDARNERAGKFYDRLGFIRYDGFEDKGEKGRQGNALCRVKKL